MKRRIRGSDDYSLVLTDTAIRRIPDTGLGPAMLGKTLIASGDPDDRVIFDRAGYSERASNAGRVFGIDGPFHDLHGSARSRAPR